MRKICFFLSAICVFLLISSLFFTSQGFVQAKTVTQDDGWTEMPAGAKPAYMGIHGGTMPVSLLVSGDGAALFTFVGRTGNDFLEALREAFLPFPSFGNSTRSGAHFITPSGETGLFAGNAASSMPVIPLTTDLFTNRSLFTNLVPFGLSPEPLSIEGQVVKPEIFPVSRKRALFFMPDYFQPRRKK